MSSISNRFGVILVTAMHVGWVTAAWAQAIPNAPFYESRTVLGTKIVSGDTACEMRVDVGVKRADYDLPIHRPSLIVSTTGTSLYGLTLEGAKILDHNKERKKFSFVAGAGRYHAFTPFGPDIPSFQSAVGQAGLDAIAMKKVFEIRQREANDTLLATVYLPDVSGALKALAFCRLARNRPAKQISNLKNDGSFAGIGRVNISFVITDSGRIANCIVAPKDRNPVLEANLCIKMLREIRFVPATDNKGSLVSTTKTITVIG